MQPQKEYLPLKMLYCWNNQSSDSDKNTFLGPQYNIYTFVSNNPKLLQEISSPQKYKSSAHENEQTDSWNAWLLSNIQRNLQKCV
jgi:hypothetical protein